MGDSHHSHIHNGGPISGLNCDSEQEKDKDKDKDKNKYKDKDKVHRRPNICYILEKL